VLIKQAKCHSVVAYVRYLEKTVNAEGNLTDWQIKVN
jgi:hypothetical protein